MHRKRPLHNFSLPELRWANQKFLRCKNPSRSAADGRRDSSAGGDCGGIAAVREEVMLDLRAAAAATMKLTMMPPEKDSSGGGDGSPAAARPWNLRTRRAACRAPEEKKVVEKTAEKAAGTVKLAVGLSRAEIEEDFRAMAGVRPPRRPKKRPRTVQKELDQLFPGLWLTEITPETYKVEDAAE